MTKEITKAIILQEIQDKFKLRELEPEIFRFLESVVPIYDVGDHLEKPLTEYASLSITTAPFAYSFFTVPQNERWYLHRYDIIFMGAGAYTVTGALVDRLVGETIYLDMTLGQTVSYHVEIQNPVRLDAGDKIKVYVDGYTSTQSLRLYIDVIKEEIR